MQPPELPPPPAQLPAAPAPAARVPGPPAPLRAAGAPRDQGIAQGRAFAAQIARWRGAQDARRGRLARWGLARAATRGAGSALAYHLVQLHERWEGIAQGANCPLGALAAPWAALRLGARAELAGGELALRLALPPALAALALLRRSEPDAAGFASLELALAPFPGCLAGVNERGAAVAVLEERGALEVPLAALAQDFLLRASDLAAGLEHLRLRARYAGGSGRLLAADASGRAAWVELERGRVALREVLPGGAAPGAPASLRIDLAARAVELAPGGGCGAPARAALH